MVKQFVQEIFILTMNFILWIPISFMRSLFLKVVLKDFYFRSYIKRNIELKKPRNISIGKNSYVNKGVVLDGRGGSLYIGRNVDIAEGVIIYTLTHDINDPLHSVYGKDVFIADYVWIGARAIIMPGVTISKGAIIGCGSVVTRNVEENCVVAGVPAKKIGERSNALEYNLKGFNLLL